MLCFTLFVLKCSLFVIAHGSYSCYFSTLYGMVFGFMYQILKRYNLIDDNNHSNLFSRGIALTATLLSIIGIGGYATFTFLCSNKPQCNEVHSYIVFIPVSKKSQSQKVYQISFYLVLSLELHLLDSALWHNSKDPRTLLFYQ